MIKRWNINSFLCEKVDDDITNIKNIFDTVTIKKDKRTNFYIVTLLNAFESDEKSFRLYYFLQFMEEGDIAYLGNHYLRKGAEVKKNKAGEPMKARIEKSVSTMLKAEIENVNFPKSGQYELQVYKYDNDDAEDIDDKSSEEQYNFANEDHLISTYPFNVKIIED